MVTRIDQGELLTVLYAEDKEPPFATFLHRLCRRTGAREAMLETRLHDGTWVLRHVAAGSTVPVSRPDRSLLADLRPGRVYGFAEIGAGPGDGRVLRLTAASGDHWLAVYDRDSGFAAADGALLSDLAVHVAAACDNRWRVAALRERLAAAEAALARAGVGWALLDAAGERIGGERPSTTPGQRAALAGAVARGDPIGVAGQAIAIAPPPSDAGSGAAALALFCTNRAPIDRARAFAASHDVTPAEARLAVAVAEGDTLAQAAQRLGITVETARFYSKRLYSATATSGQADLVRLFWSGPAALA